MSLTMQDKVIQNYDRDYLEPPDHPEPPEPKEQPAGFYGIGANKGIYVKPQAALSYAMERSGILIANMSTFEKEWGEGGKWFVECFYSGDWMEVK